MRKGDKLGRFVLEDDLGFGGMGGVFVGSDEETGRKVSDRITTDASRLSQSWLSDANSEGLSNEAYVELAKQINSELYTGFLANLSTIVKDDDDKPDKKAAE